MHSLGRQPTGGSETWPRPGIAGLRSLAGNGVSRRPKAVRNPRYGAVYKTTSPGGAADHACGVSRRRDREYLSPLWDSIFSRASFPGGSRPRLNIFRRSAAHI